MSSQVVWEAAHGVNYPAFNWDHSALIMLEIWAEIQYEMDLGPVFSPDKLL